MDGRIAIISGAVFAGVVGAGILAGGLEGTLGSAAGAVGIGGSTTSAAAVQLQDASSTSEVFAGQPGHPETSRRSNHERDEHSGRENGSHEEDD